MSGIEWFDWLNLIMSIMVLIAAIVVAVYSSN